VVFPGRTAWYGTIRRADIGAVRGAIIRSPTGLRMPREPVQKQSVSGTVRVMNKGQILLL